MGFRGDLLRALRENEGYSMEELGKRLGLTKYQVHRYETGASDPSSTLVGELADFFGVSVDYLHGRTEKKEDNTQDEEYDSLTEITKYVQQLGFTSMGFFDIEKWKNLGPEEVEELKRHFDYVLHKAIEKKKQQGN